MTDNEKMREDAVREAARNHAGDEYFNADRAYLLVSPYSGRIFDAGFDRGWQAAQSVPVDVAGIISGWIGHTDEGKVFVDAAELERLRKDAARYAVVRDSTYCDVYMHEIYLTDDDLDAAIDAAIAGEKE